MKANLRTKRIALALLFVALSIAANVCEAGSTGYRATVKLLVTRAGMSVTSAEELREADTTFYETQTAILQSQTLLHRTGKRLKMDSAEVRQSLTGVDVVRLGKSDVIIITVTGSSERFVSEFATSLVDEYLKWRDEQRAEAAETALLQLTREITRLSQELKATNERLRAYAKEKGLKLDAETPELQDLRDDRDRVRALYNALLGQLMKIDVTQEFRARHITVLEPAIVTPIEKP